MMSFTGGLHLTPEVLYLSQLLKQILGVLHLVAEQQILYKGSKY